MTTYKYLSDAVVAKIDDDGLSRMSCTIENPEYLAWLAEGNAPLPANAVDQNTSILAQIEALERAVMTPRDTREMKIEWAEDKAIAMGAAAASAFTLTQFNQTIQYYGLTLTTEQQDSVALGVVPPFTPQQSIDIAYATNVAYRLNVDLDNQIRALRAQLV